MLTKGPQAPTYFLGGVALFLLVTGRWRELLQRPAWIGLAVFVVLWATWQTPYCLPRRHR